MKQEVFERWYQHVMCEFISAALEGNYVKIVEMDFEKIVIMYFSYGNYQKILNYSKLKKKKIPTSIQICLKSVHEFGLSSITSDDACYFLIIFNLPFGVNIKFPTAYRIDNLFQYVEEYYFILL